MVEIKRSSSGPSRLSDGRYQILLNTVDLPEAWIMRFKMLGARADVADLRVQLLARAVTCDAKLDEYHDQRQSGEHDTYSGEDDAYLIDREPG